MRDWMPHPYTVGVWLSAFVRQCRKSDFSLARYLEQGAASEPSSSA